MSRHSRLFQRLEQGIGRLIVHVLGVLDDKDAHRTFERAKVRLAFEFAHRPHANDVVVRSHHCHVSVLAPNHSFLVVVGAGEHWKG